MKYSPFFLPVFLIFLLLSAGCGKTTDKSETPQNKEVKTEPSADTLLKLSQTSILAADVEFERAEKTMFPYEFQAKGKVTILANAQADVASPFKGTVKQFFAKEGQIAWLVSYIADRSKRVKKIM